MHMKCALCKYEFCFVCGLPYKSVFHYSQYGGLVCEMIGGSFVRKRKCVAFLLTSSIIIFLPVIVIFFGMLLVGAGQAALTEMILNS